MLKDLVLIQLNLHGRRVNLCAHITVARRLTHETKSEVDDIGKDLEREKKENFEF